MYIPKTTYRIQFSSAFTFKDLESRLSYLEKLGIDTIYASPIFKAQPGSGHGYDVADFTLLNPELGSVSDFERLMQKLHRMNMAWIQDIVPNHMAFSLENQYIVDVLKYGQESQYAQLFDIYWDHHDAGISGKIMAPVLGADPEEVIENEELTLQYKKGNFVLSYYENNFPINAQSVKYVLSVGLQNGMLKSDAEHEPDENSAQRLCQYINHYHESLAELTQMQHYLLCHWQATERKINYRRFFTVNDLICLRQEDEEVFATTHKLIAQYYREGFFQGVRVDHIDGLLKPTQYLHRLRRLLGEEAYILVEKILDKNEKLPQNWPVQGTTGYDYLGAVNQLIIRKGNEEAFTRFYHRYINRNTGYLEIVKEKKRLVLRQRMAGELDNLLELLAASSAKNNPQLNYREALTHLLCAFPVYRTYIEAQNAESLPLFIEDTVASSDDFKEELAEIREVFWARHPEDLAFVLRFQQLSGPLAAKGVEDTAFYQYNRFISQNEVGDEPSEFGMTIAKFHEYVRERHEKWPLAMNSSSTHDTKRGEDTRARLAAMGQNPHAWEQFVQDVENKNNNSGPVANDRYMILQSLVGGWPLEAKTDDDFKQRFREFLQKALREGKSQTSWSSPNQQYEKACFSYSNKLMNDREFISGFVKTVNRQAIFYSLVTSILKFTLPGIPDVYQGCESWNFSFVDPDNRRPAAYKKFGKILDDLHQREKDKNISEFLGQLWNEDITNESLKILITQKLIQLRRAEPDLLVYGDYVPLEAGDKCLAFLREYETKWLFVYLAMEENTEFDVKLLPENAPRTWENIFTKEKAEIGTSSNFPFVCLRSTVAGERRR